MSTRVALTQTVNAFSPMPTSTSALGELADQLDAVVRANVEHHVDLIAHAAELGAKAIGLGELFAAPYFALDQNPMWRALAEPIDGPTVTRLREVARAKEILIVAPIYERDGNRRFNTAVVIERTGEVLGTYRKTHIPNGTNETATFSEGFYYDRSDGGMLNPGSDRKDSAAVANFFPTFETSLGTIGVAICYDRHFEGVMSALARNGARLVFCPAVTFGKKSQHMWRQEFAVDAMRHRLVIGGSNRAGAEPPWNVPYFGESHFVGPDGPCANLSDHPKLVVSDVDLSTLSGDDTSGWALARDRRPDIY